MWVINMRDLLTKTSCNHKLGDLVFSLNQCPRCLGDGVYFDVNIGIGGDFNLVENSSRLVQDVEKSLLEHVGSNIEDSLWGSALYSLSKINNYALTRGFIVSSVVNALSHLRDLLIKENFDYVLPSSEKIHINGIKDLKIMSDNTEPRKLIIQISVYSEDYIQPVNINIPVNI